MATRGFGLGQDCTVAFQASKGSQFYTFSTFGADLLGFESSPDLNIVRQQPMSNGGRKKRRIERYGWKGTISLGRINGDPESIEIQAFQDYRNGNPDTTYAIFVTVSNQDGSETQSEYQYTNCSLWISKGSNYRPGEAVMITYEFEGDDVTEIA